MKLKHAWVILAAALCAPTVAEKSQASQCVDRPFQGRWLARGSAPSFPGTPNAYQLGAIQIGMKCLDNTVITCDPSGESCTHVSGVRAVLTVSVGVLAPSFTGPVDVHYWQAVDAQEGTEGWHYGDTIVLGNPTRVWFRPWGNGLQGAFDVTVNGKVRSSGILEFVR